MFRRSNIDWKTFAGFSGLLFLIIVIGLIGIHQIQILSKIVNRLALSDVPIQNAVLEMKSSNNKYAMGVRSYMYWRGSKYLESAAVGAKLNLVREASRNFDEYRALYESLVVTPGQKEWANSLRLSEAQLRSIGEAIIDLVNRMDSSGYAEKTELEAGINRQMMAFENTLYRIDAFLEDPVQKYNLSSIDARLAVAQAGRRNSIIFLSWSLFVGLILAAQTAFLIQRRSKREREHREMLWRTVIRVEEEERNNLSLQIHDQMGQDLSAIKIYLGLIERELVPEAADERDKIEKAKKIIDELMGKAHNISELLRPPELDDLGLSESIAALVEQYKQITEVSYNFSKPPGEVKLLPEFSLVLYRVAQEALTNITKHSNAKNVDIFFEVQKNSVFLSVSDDGVGFDYAQYLHKPSRRREDKVKLGLSGLKERIELLGGRLVIETKPGHGARLEVVLPIA